MTTAAVEDLIGPPNGQRSLADEREVWVYVGNIRLDFHQGRLENARGIPFSVENRVVDDGRTIIVGSEPSISITETPDPVSMPQGAESEPAVSAPEQMIGTMDAITQERQDMLEEVSQVELEAGDDEAWRSGFAWWALGMLFFGQTFFTFILLLFAFKVTGQEAMAMALAGVAAIDTVILNLTQVVMTVVIGFPDAMNLDSLLTFLTMIITISAMTHAKSLPKAIQVAVAVRVINVVFWWLLGITMLGIFGVLI